MKTIAITDEQVEQIIKFVADYDVELCIAGGALVDIGLEHISDVKQKLEDSKKNNERLQAEIAFMDAVVDGPYGIVRC